MAFGMIVDFGIKSNIDWDIQSLKSILLHSQTAAIIDDPLGVNLKKKKKRNIYKRMYRLTVEQPWKELYLIFIHKIIIFK